MPKITVYEVDKDGFIIERHISDKSTTKYITTNLPDGLFKVKWNGEMWVEGKTEEEFIEDAFLATLNPSPYEIAKAERELETIELLIEMGLI